jgi:FADH2-dependent halogenase
MSATQYDALIIGGGPGGSTAATFLARAGKRVLLMEKERFPRFHIGESLLPYNRQIFAEMGVLPKLEGMGLIRKHGAQFHLGNGSQSLALIFRNGCFTRELEAFQVERSIFDHALLEHAQQCGAEVREACTVARFSTDADGATVQTRNEKGTTETFRGAFLIDASGRGNLTGNQEGLREVYPNHRKLAVFGHFAGVGLDPGVKGGDTIIVRLENKWFWIIPLNAEKTSVGCVMDPEEFASARESPERIFTRLWESSPPLRERMQPARLLGAMHTTSDFSYYNRRFVGQRLLRVGDAAAFMDPIFSAGVYLACYSGKLAARVVTDSLAAGDDGGRQLKRYERRIHRAMTSYWKMVEGFYTTPFMEMFMSPRDKFNLPAAVVALLAGELEGGWKIRWRMWLFFAFVKLQTRWPLVPRICFDPNPGRSNQPAPVANVIGAME